MVFIDNESKALFKDFVGLVAVIRDCNSPGAFKFPLFTFHVCCCVQQKEEEES
jgi:hypothetical protein